MVGIIIKDGKAGPFNTKEGFERPNHPDFMDSTELRKTRFTGLRHNSLSNEAEIWILGHVVERVTEAEVQLNPLAINNAYERAFDLPEIMPDTDEAKRFIAIREGMLK